MSTDAGVDDATLAAMSSAMMAEALEPGMLREPSEAERAEAEETRREQVAEFLAALEAAEAAAAAVPAGAEGLDGATTMNARGTSDSEGEEADAESTEAPPEDNEAEEEEEEEEGMGMPVGTVESSWGGEGSDWSLERIVRRRKAVRRTVTGTASLKAEYQSADSVGWEYCCVWRGYADATWERRGFLEDLGYGRELSEYDVTHPAAVKATSRPTMPKKPSRFERGEKSRNVSEAKLMRQRELARERARAQWRTLAYHFHDLPVLHLFSDSSFGLPSSVDTVAVRNEFPDASALSLLLRVIFDLSQAQCVVESVEIICPRSLGPALKALRSRQATLLYHGTRPIAVGPISRIGLVVPGLGNDVKVANGSAHGVGIYTATTPHTPVGYAHEGDMFVCVGANSGPSVQVVGEYRVYSDASIVTPFLKLKVRRVTSTPPLYENPPLFRG
jgi:hypothetical protein